MVGNNIVTSGKREVSLNLAFLHAQKFTLFSNAYKLIKNWLYKKSFFKHKYKWSKRKKNLNIYVKNCGALSFYVGDEDGVPFGVFGYWDAFKTAQLVNKMI